MKSDCFVPRNRIVNLRIFIVDYWMEVYVEKRHDMPWLPINIKSNEIDQPENIAAQCQQPISYVLAFDNGKLLVAVISYLRAGFG